MTTDIIDIVNKSALRLFAKCTIDLGITIEYIKHIHKPPTFSENKILMIEEGKYGHLYDLLNYLRGYSIYVNNDRCYLGILSRLLIIPRYHEFLKGELDDLEPIIPGTVPRISWAEETKNLIEYIENTYPFSAISTRKVSKIEDIENLLTEYCNKHSDKYTQLEEHPDIEDIRPEKIIEIIDEILWDLTMQNITQTISMTLHSHESMYTNIGHIDSFVLLIDTLKDKGYPVKDYVLEGKELLINLKNALEITLDIESGIERSKEDLQQLDITLDLIKNTYPLKIIADELGTENFPKLLQDFLLGNPVIITPEMLIPPKEIININTQNLKNLLDETLKENPEAKIAVDFSIHEIEKILESTQYTPRYGIKDEKEAAVYTTLFYATITDDLNISFIPFFYESKPESTPKNRIYANINLESYKNILGNVIRNNPDSIIGDIIIEYTKDLKDLVDILIESNTEYVIKIDILQKDQDTIRELYKTIDSVIDSANIDISKIVLKSTIYSAEISDVFNRISGYRLLTLHLGNIKKVC